MRNRHRIPSIFSLSMVDVLCCALGCVIVLWLLAQRQADENDSVGEELTRTQSLLAETESTLERSRAKLTSSEAELLKMLAQLTDLQTNLADTKSKLTDEERRRLAALAKLATTEDSLKTSEEQSKKLKLNLSTEEQKVTGLIEKLTALEKALASLQLEKSKTDETLKSQKLDAKELEAQLRALLAQLELKLKDREALLASAEKKSADLDRLRRLLESDLDIQKDKTDEAKKKLAAADNRFAGITLTGRRVLFLVDMSGSMRLVKRDSPAPGKWPEVVTIVGKVMASLPDLEKFQVILFSDKVSFPLGKDGDWLDFEKAKTPGEVTKLLTEIKPQGGTNMYAALDAAFRYRSAGLDALYLFSDGLPNLGQPLTSFEERQLEDDGRTPAAVVHELTKKLKDHVQRKVQLEWNREQVNLNRVKINTVGFFYENNEIGSFLWALSRDNDGSFVGMSKP